MDITQDSKLALKIDYKGRERFFHFSIDTGDGPDTTLYKGAFDYNEMTVFTFHEMSLVIMQAALNKKKLEEYKVVPELSAMLHDDEFNYWCLFTAAETLTHPEYYNARHILLHQVC